MPFPHLAAARRRVVRRLEQAGAVSPETAMPLAGLRGLERGRLRHLVTMGVIHEAAPERYWLDEIRYAEYANHLRRMAILAVIAVFVALFFVVELAGRP
ncbi:MAG TPA: hypothetical protein VFB67_00970 [Candidatus Polarisedimenticolaceae bacterium]|nr:hypothetical protein [Candidatus Polarisedimenticolaceae bacterium]